jgi:hypothetical protein
LAGISAEKLTALKIKTMFKNYLITINATDRNRCNCVKWVRDRIPNLPYGLWTIWDKKKIIDTQNAKIGRVAIMSVGWPWGHLGIVKEKGSNRVVIQEANYKRCQITERQGTPKELKIIGYFNPNKKHWQ